MNRRLLWTVLLMALAAAPLSATGQMIYKCKDKNGVIGYSSQPCSSELVSTIRPDAGPSEAEHARALARVAAETERFRGQEEAAAELRAARRAADMQRFSRSTPEPRNNPANEKVMVHSQRGWDYKTRGQIAAEGRARAKARGEIVQEPTGKAGWEDEKVLRSTSRGWETPTRAAIVAAEGEKERRRLEAAARERRNPSPSLITSCDPGGCYDNLGNRYNGSGTTFFRTDGRVCQKLGDMLQCN